MRYRLLSWNVNGLRAVEKKGFLNWFYQDKPFLLAMQETKAYPEQLSDQLRHPEGYYAYWSSAERKGYSGVGLYSREAPRKIEYGFGIEEFDCEGRIIIAEYPTFFLYNIYFPNGKSGNERLQYKLNFYAAFLDSVRTKMKHKKSIVICGDVNTAHCEIDLARPKENCTVSGFLPQERSWIDTFISQGLVDTFRVFNSQGGNYTWWDYQTRARERNVGWRIDYFFIDKKSLPFLKQAFILSDVYGSDHCPIGIEMEWQ